MRSGFRVTGVTGWLRVRAPGLLVCLAIAAVSSIAARFVPLIGSALPAMIIGLVWALVRRPGPRYAPGITTATKTLLQIAIVLLGARMSLGQAAAVGLDSLPVLLSSLVVCLIAAHLIGRALGVERDTRILLGVGTGICGASAIAAISPVIRANPAQIAYAISTVFIFNVAAVLTFPWVGHALGYDAATFGLFAGTAVNDTSSVVAAASIFSTAALGYAIVVKLVRTLALIPIALGLALLEARRSLEAGGRMGPRQVVKLVPWFLVGFVLMVVLNTLVGFSTPVVEILSVVSTFLIATALAGIGLSTDFGAIRRAGSRPLLLGGILWLLVTAVTIGVIALVEITS